MEINEWTKDHISSLTSDAKHETKKKENGKRPWLAINKHSIEEAEEAEVMKGKK